MKIAALGTINHDTVVLPQGEVIESYGGLLYSILPLALLAEPGTTIVPVVNLGRDVEHPVKAILSRHSRISQEGIRMVPERNNRVLLRYTSHGEREEVQQGGLPPLTFEQIAPFLDADVLLVNFISGRELSLETLRRVRAHTMATIYMDIHSLSLGIDQEGRRFWRQIPNWPEWVAQADVVQVNRGEARLLAGGPVETEREVLSLGRMVLEAGPAILLLTLGSRGSMMISASGEDPRLWRFDPQPPAKVRDTTGCGDVFLAAFVAEHVRSGDPHKASRFANLAAGAKSGFSGIEELEGLKELRAKWTKNC